MLFKVNDIDDLERKMKSLIFGKNLSVDPTSYLNIYGEGTLINSYWGYMKIENVKIIYT